jgi:chitinase
LFPVTLDKASKKAVVVKYITSNGSATAGLDYVATYGTITFLPGQTLKTVSVTVKGDTIKSINETFFVSIYQAVNANISVSKATGTIVNDD